MRVGGVEVNVSTAGFILNTKGYSAMVDPLVLHGKVYDFGRLFLKWEKQAANSVVKHTLFHWKDAFVKIVKTALHVDGTKIEEKGEEEKKNDQVEREILLRSWA